SYTLAFVNDGFPAVCCAFALHANASIVPVIVTTAIVLLIEFSLTRIVPPSPQFAPALPVTSHWSRVTVRCSLFAARFFIYSTTPSDTHCLPSTASATVFPLRVSSTLDLF